MTSIRHTTVRHKTALTFGFLCLTAALALAYRRPASGYELSVYTSTPAGFWLAITLALIVALVVVASAPELGAIRNAALLLATMSVLAVVAIPLLRSYTYYGAGDSLSHLGWAREIHQGILSPSDLLYPGIHLMANFIAELGGVPLTQSLVLLPTLVFPLVSVVFFGLCLRALSDSQWAFPIGVLVGLLFLPVNGVSIHIVTHPSSQAVLFLPVVLYLLIRHLTADTERVTLATPFGILFAIATIGMLFIHPQETFVFLAVLLGVVAVQLLAGWFWPKHPIASHRPVGLHAVLLALVFFVWTVRHERARSRVGSVFLSVLGRTGDTLSAASSRSASLTQLGGSIEELFVKLFAVSLLFCLLAAFVSLYSMRSRFRGKIPRDPAVAYLTVGLVPIVMIFVAVFFAKQGDHYFRIMGSMMVLVALLGALGLTMATAGLDRRFDRSTLVTVLTVVFVVMVAMQLLTIHSSPYLYQANGQVTEQELDGHAVAFEHHDGQTAMTGIRGGPRRFVDAYYGFTTASNRLDFPGYREGIPGPVFRENLTTHYEEDRYVVITEGDYKREVGLYDGFRYPASGFRQFETSPRINRVQDNGEFRLYRVDSD